MHNKNFGNKGYHNQPRGGGHGPRHTPQAQGGRQ